MSCWLFITLLVLIELLVVAQARIALQGCVQRLRDIAETSENKLLCHNCNVAVDTVTWQP